MATELSRIIRSIADGTGADPRAIRSVLAHDVEAAEAAIDLARKVDSLRRRSTELRAVMSSTRDLLSIPDADLMLQRIVDRARELMEVDVAYLSVYDSDHDELHVRAQTGTVSPRFFGMVVPAGVGLASLAVRTQRPQWVADYESLTTVPHDVTIDAIVHEEQLRSLLGAPLVVGGQVLGVLFAASRQPHDFRPEEISLLSAFAGHAALVLHLAQLLKDATDASAEASSRQQEAEWAASLHGELIKLVVFGHDTDAVVGALAEALGRDVVFIDDEGSTLVGDAEVALDRQLREAVVAAAATGRSVEVADSAFELVTPVVATTARSGALLVSRGAHPLTPIERRTVERSALIAALVMLRHNALADAEERVRGEVAAELLQGATTRMAGVRRAAARGYLIAAPWTVAAVSCAPDERQRVLSRLRGRADWLAAPARSG
ncbi:GAF domain-containing protein [Microbacterium sp. CH12i]|uniref:GAF domain-containing protein n=1 Tax=Microbacterium sp. CH12i TaxID=1479651 RepID=UPI00068CFFC3|nr:GAF domain-containing protein [Microbacterium sp. CH12i]